MVQRNVVHLYPPITVVSKNMDVKMEHIVWFGIVFTTV